MNTRMRRMVKGMPMRLGQAEVEELAAMLALLFDLAEYAEFARCDDVAAMRMAVTRWLTKLTVIEEEHV